MSIDPALHFKNAPRPPMYRWMERRHHIKLEHGFTIIEVMVAMLILVGGMAGTLTLLDQANAKTTTDKAREGAVALSRELVEAARSQPYDQLTQGSVVSAIRSQTGFAGTTVTGSGWRTQRRGITYTMAVGVCSVDDPVDELGAEDTTFCAGTGTTTAAQCESALGSTGAINGTGTASGTTVGDCGIDVNFDGRVDNLTLGDTGCTSESCGGGTLDTNPDDYKRVVTLVRWSIGKGTHYVLESTTLPYPGLSGAPRVTDLTTASVSLTDPTQASLTATALTNRKAAKVSWSLDGTPSGVAMANDATGRSWNITWTLKAAGCPGPAPVAGEVLDGAYVFGAKAADAYGQSGPTKALTMTLNRCLPYKPANPTVALIGGSGVEAVWNPNAEHDIEGYQLFRQQGTGSVQNVCPRSRALACTETSPPSSGTWDYYISAFDRGSSGFRQGQNSNKIQINLSDQVPNPPAGALTGSRLSASSTTISWLPSTGDPDGSVIGYQVYRDGTSLSERYGGVLPATATSFTDNSAVTGHTYYVAAVDNNTPVAAESAKTAGLAIP